MALNQLKALDGAMAAYTLYTVDAGLNARPGYAGSPSIIRDDHFVAFAQRAMPVAP